MIGSAPTVAIGIMHRACAAISAIAQQRSGSVGIGSALLVATTTMPPGSFAACVSVGHQGPRADVKKSRSHDAKYEKDVHVEASPLHVACSW